MNRRQLLQAAPAAALALAGRPVWSQEKAVIRIIIPYAAGGLTDIMARTLQHPMSQTLGRTVIVENRMGAAGLIATRAVQTAAPDATALLFHNTGFAAIPRLQKGANYDPSKDFAPVAIVGDGPNFLMVHQSVPATNMAEFVAWAKTQPQGIEAANSGLGSSGHLSSMLFAKRAGIKIVHVPYKGSAETANALISGEVKMQLTATTEVLNQQVKAGKVRILAVSTRGPTPLAPDVPTVASSLPGFVIDGWFGLLTTAGSPPAEVAKISDSVRLALQDTELRDRFKALYIAVRYANPAQFAVEVREADNFWKSVADELGIQPQ